MLLAPGGAEARVCVTGLPLCQLIPGVEVIFEGTVESIRREPRQILDDKGSYRLGGLWARFRDVNEWRGRHQLEVSVGWDEDHGAKFVAGTRYLVLASTRPDGSLVAHGCGLTQPLDEAAELIAYLQALSKPGPGAYVLGRALVTGASLPLAPAGESHGVPNVVVRLRGPVARSTLTDDEGNFAIRSLPPGDYELTASLSDNRPDLVPLDDKPQRVQLRGAHACATTTLGFSFDGAVRGQVFDADGTPATSVTVDLRPLVEDHGIFRAYVTAATNAVGEFQFLRVPPGEYVVGVNLQTGPSARNPYLTVRVATDSGGGPGSVSLGAGQKLELPPVVITRLTTTARVAGQVLLPDGRPARQTQIVAAPIGEFDDRPHVHWDGQTTTDDDGRFVLELLHGVRYALDARIAFTWSTTRVVAGDGQPVTVRLTTRNPYRK